MRRRSTRKNVYRHPTIVAECGWHKKRSILCDHSAVFGDASFLIRNVAWISTPIAAVRVKCTIRKPICKICPGLMGGLGDNAADAAGPREDMVVGENGEVMEARIQDSVSRSLLFVPFV